MFVMNSEDEDENDDAGVVVVMLRVMRVVRRDGSSGGDLVMKVVRMRMVR